MVKNYKNVHRGERTEILYRIIDVFGQIVIEIVVAYRIDYEYVLSAGFIVIAAKCTRHEAASRDDECQYVPENM